MVHIHGEDIYFEQVSKYPVQIVNWHDRETSPSLAQAQKTFKGVLCGGLAEKHLFIKQLKMCGKKKKMQFGKRMDKD